MERFGFVGLPNAGKSSLYNALAGGGALAAPYAFATVDPNVGRGQGARRPPRPLGGDVARPRTVVPATVQFVDIAGLVEGAAQGEGLGNRFLAHIREVDAIVFVLRAFVDDDVPGSSDPVEQLGILEVELVYADLETVEKQVEKRRKAARVDKSLADEVAALDAAIEVLQTGTPIYRCDLDDEQRAAAEAVLPAHQQAGDGGGQRRRGRSSSDPEPVLAPVREAFGAVGDERVIGVCVQLEAEAALLDEDERAEMLDALGLGEGALPAFLHTAYQMLGLRTFFTTGEKETRAWTFRAGLQGPAGRRRHPHRLRAGVHPGRDHPLGRAARGRVVVEGPRRRAGSGSRARTTWSPTVTSSTSASTSDATLAVLTRAPTCDHVPMTGAPSQGWLVHDGRVLASAEVATTRAGRRRGLLGRDGIDGVLVIATPGRCTPSACASRSTWRSATRTAPSAAPSHCGRTASPGRCVAR